MDRPPLARAGATLQGRAIAKRLHCCGKTVSKALLLTQPPATTPKPRGSILDPYRPATEKLLAQYPELSAVRVLEEISKGPQGYRGGISLVRACLRQLRPARGRVYREVHYEPGEAMQVDWGECGRVRIGRTRRRVSVFVAVLCYSRLCYIEFTLAQRKADFYRSLVHALQFYGGSPRKIIFDNLRAAVVNGSGRHACLHPEFLALCGLFCLQPLACERRDPESKGVVEAGVRYVKQNALQGRTEELSCWDDYQRLAVYWRDQVANVRQHQSTRERPVDRFEKERSQLRALPAAPVNTDEIVSAVVTSHARIHYDGNRYSVPPKLVRRPVVVRADATTVRIVHQGQEVARHQRCYEKRQVLVQTEHLLAARQQGRRCRARQLEEEFDALGPQAREWHLKLLACPVKTSVHLRRLLSLARLYGKADVRAAIGQALALQTYDAAYVERLLLQERRRRELPSPLPLRPKRPELIEEIQLEEPDPGIYDRLFDPPPREDTP